MPASKIELPPEAATYLADHPDSVAIDVIYPDLCGICRGKRYPMNLFAKLMTEGLATPGSVFLLDVVGENHDSLGMGFSDGDPDCLVKTIPGTLKPVPWARQPTGQVLVTFEAGNGTPYPFEPRNVLRKTLTRLEELALRPVVAFELEFYLIDRERLAGGRPQPPLSPISGKRMRGTQVYGMAEVDAFAELIGDITDACEIQGIETGAITKEYAPGPFEINLHHLDDPLLAADQCIMFKRIVRAVAQRHGVEATFMAKPYGESAGSGLHLHCSLLNGDGVNVFAEDEAGNARSPATSQNLRHAIAGILELMPESMAILAPNPNSFRRFEPNIFVPITRSWGHENRSVALRIPTGDRKARRIEHRIAGADANPYLALATIFAGLHHGLANAVEPPPASDGNAGTGYDDALAFRPRRALERMAQSSLLADYLGADFTQAYVDCKLAELDKFDSIMSPAEFEWFLQTE